MKLRQRGISMDEELLDEIFADLAVDLVDLSDDEIKDRILKYGLDPADMQDIYNTVKDVQEAEALAGENPDPLSLENVDALADANTKAARRIAEGKPEPQLYQLPADGPAHSKTRLATAEDMAKGMANEDQTKVKITEEDVDSDDDTDKVTIEKEEPEDDMELTDEERSIIESMGTDEGTDEGTEEPDNSSETEDKPREEPKIKNKTNQFARFLGENRLGGM